MAFSPKNASFWGRQNLPQNTPKLTILGFKNDTKSLLLAEIELRRCFCVAHIPGYQNNTLETILEPLLAAGSIFRKNAKIPHFGPFLVILGQFDNPLTSFCV